MLTDSASARRGRWSSARRRLPDSSRLNVDTSMRALRAHVLQRQPVLHAQFTEPPSDPQVDIVFKIFACMAN